VSPVRPFIVQRRYRELGRIRLGDKGGAGGRRRLSTFRLTSPSRPLLENAAELWGGQVQEWKGAPTEGTQYELTTEASELPVMVPTQDMEGSQYLELWTAGGVKRRCDGETELISGRKCKCDPEAPECKITTHLILVLPQIPDLGVWRLTTHGFNAAAELPETVRLLQHAYAEGHLPGATLAIESRTSKEGGETRHFTVPVLKVPFTLQEMAGGSIERGVPVLAIGRAALPEGPKLEEKAAGWAEDGAPHGAPPPLPGEETSGAGDEATGPPLTPAPEPSSGAEAEGEGAGESGPADEAVARSPSPAPEDGELAITDKQMRLLHKLAREHDWSRKDRLEVASVAINREIGSFNELTSAEASSLIEGWEADSEGSGSSPSDAVEETAHSPGPSELTRGDILSQGAKKFGGPISFRRSVEEKAGKPIDQLADHELRKVFEEMAS